jgi:hypothetical protein
VVRADADWLALREPADATARALEPVALLRRRLPRHRPLVVHDLGSGTGAMARWLAPLLPGPQRWVLHDRDTELLDRAAAHAALLAADGSAVEVETRQDDVSRLTPDDLEEADLLTASALLDMMDAPELDRFVTSCVQASCPVLLTLTVVGRVGLTPPDPLDRLVAAAFNAHQRRTVGARTLLGPDASAAAVAQLSRLGHDVRVRPSPWRLGPAHRALTTAWLTGWVGAAAELRPDLQHVLEPYARRRLAQAEGGALQVRVHHEDVLALPGRRVRP